MLAIVATLLWIALDIGVSLVTAPALPPWEWWTILLGGVGLGVLALIGEILDRRSHAKEISRIFEGQASHSTDHEILAKGSIAILAAVTKTTGEPGEKTIEAAALKIEELTKQIAELKEDTRHVTRSQRRRFGQALPSVLPELFELPPRFEYKGVRITYGSTLEAQNYAEDLSRLFGEHALTTSTAKEVTHESLNIPGLRVLIADSSNPTPHDRKTMALLDAAGIDYEIERRATEFPDITVLRVGVTISR